jgi:hypothetical protein
MTRSLVGAGGAALVAGAALALAAPAAADITVVVDSQSTGPSRLDRLNATTGAPLPLPAGLNDPTQSERHPSLSPDGHRLVFQRSGTGGTRIIMVDLRTGQRADLFNPFEAAADPPSTPTFSSDGATVITGRRLERRDPASPPRALQTSFTVTDVTGFPNGPFPKQVVAGGGPDLVAPGRTVQPTPFPASSFAFGISHANDNPLGSIGLMRSGATALLSDPVLRLAGPTISQAAGVVVFEGSVPGLPFRPRLLFRPLEGFAAAPTTTLPPIVNAPGTVLRVPEFSRDGRYLAFRRSESDAGGPQRVFVWDTQTQLLLNPDGVLGLETGASADDSAIAIGVEPVLLGTTVKPRSVNVAVASPTGVGIVVQRVVGRTRVLGRGAPALRLVGRVPLGSFRRGRHAIPWDGRVGGRTLAPGEYRVTVRAVTGAGRVRDLGRPQRVRIRSTAGG